MELVLAKAVGPPSAPLKALAFQLFERRELAAAIEVLKTERNLHGPDPELVLLELACRSALDQEGAGELLRAVMPSPIFESWLPDGAESASRRAELEGGARRFVPRIAPTKGHRS